MTGRPFGAGWHVDPALSSRECLFLFGASSSRVHRVMCLHPIADKRSFLPTPDFIPLLLVRSRRLPFENPLIVASRPWLGSRLAVFLIWFRGPSVRSEADIFESYLYLLTALLFPPHRWPSRFFRGADFDFNGPWRSIGSRSPLYWLKIFCFGGSGSFTPPPLAVSPPPFHFCSFPPFSSACF